MDETTDQETTMSHRQEVVKLVHTDRPKYTRTGRPTNQRVKLTKIKLACGHWDRRDGHVSPKSLVCDLCQLRSAQISGDPT
jgi:hypothetical protein